MSGIAPAGAGLRDRVPRGADHAMCCRLFLGRGPGGSEPPPDLRDFRSLVRRILETDAFKAVVLPPLLLREPLPHTGLAEPVPSYPTIDWAQDHLPLDATTRRAVGAARTWALLLELILSDPGITRLVPELAAAGIDEVLRDRVRDAIRVDGAIVGAVDSASAFEVSGWAFDFCDKSTPLDLEIYADDSLLGTVSCREPRPDVKDTVGGTGACGFTFKIAAADRAGFGTGRLLRVVEARSKRPIGDSVRVQADAARGWDQIADAQRELREVRKILERIEARLPDLGRIASLPIEAYDEYWERFYRPSPGFQAEQRTRSQEFDYRPVISIILPSWNGETRLINEAIQSVAAQTYQEWELIIADDASTLGDALTLLLRRHAANEPRIRLIEGATRLGIAGNTNRALAEASGDYVAFLDHDDRLAPDALFEIVTALQGRRYGLLYSDEDRIETEEDGRIRHHSPYFKPDFDPDLLLSMNYICHLVVVRRDLVQSLGGLRPGVEGAQDHDLLLRLTEALDPADIRHIPRILYHWRVLTGSVSESPERVREIERHIVEVVSEHLARRGILAEITNHVDPYGSNRRFATRIRWPLPEPAPMLSIIVPTRDRVDLLGPCLDSVLGSLAHYPAEVEILVVDNDSAEPRTHAYFARLTGHPAIRLLEFRGGFNWSAINNFAADAARGEVLIFLNNDTAVLSPDWCRELAAHAMRPDIGAVGARLLFADGTIQHAGVILGLEGLAGHDALGEVSALGGYYGRSHVLHDCTAVTGACLATRRELFRELGGFDELDLKIAFNDVDYCLKARDRGYRIVYNPFAVLHHYESKSRGRDLAPAQQSRHRFETAVFRARWGARIDEDPFYNPHFERYARAHARLRPPPATP